ncbi:MAG TPA: hypothetical protein DCW55_04580 [Candidatus Pacebacteria bacterium]|uniref:Uncharacterized protein n=1 Tax=Candidatus Woesebacteria bacterium GW2011_GWA2_44_33 TaxID=1618564 RepID=A0A0G1LAX9_9BACT|nr:MAG: hypothetical protein UW18_C0006G0095 [Microgenomates group bacterium GW2011_GWF1_44_10]KKT65817.1 MAG: hypothetical protein UW60_C0034G0003 [Candidatus Woesebacteria bacterium GW2011_GWA2_44_33]OGH20496.1 MAG: hypothetical protein A2695_03505 [Candidatus Levybacteria bacterium RIFCSPHIGHO2_01_FULL_40_83]OGH70158.1 MAG: hypothetical protein A2396_01385 [Candidatus Levybacteria bacterium RIFOXYB1_FULL_40_17]OGI97437.1 MAG: hypothetical protein A3A11_02385 [Candidatus Nomurabacteria bacter
MTETAAQKTTNNDNTLILTNSLITREELDEFKEIALKEYGVRLTDEQAFEQATALLLLVDTLIEKTLANKRNRVNINTILK